MAILPGYDTRAVKLVFNDEQLKWCAVIQCTTAFVIICMSIFWMINFWRVIIGSKKYKVLPLLTFYILALPLLAVSFYVEIWYFPHLMQV